MYISTPAIYINLYYITTMNQIRLNFKTRSTKKSVELSREERWEVVKRELVMLRDGSLITYQEYKQSLQLFK